MMRLSAAPARRRGFTLVEMLVSVALVVLMMTLFATIFEIATGTMSKQKGLAENDQKARRVSTVLQADLQKRTYRRVVPMQTGIPPTTPAKQEGYLSISENDPSDDTDDVLSFTIATFNTLKNKDTTPVYGRAVQLIGGSYDQPEFDDGGVQPNESAASQLAEIVYFLRGGNLYRRVLLVRQPYVDTKSGVQPKKRNAADTDDIPFFGGTVAPYDKYTKNCTISGGSDVFYRDFDFAAWNDQARSGPSAIPVFATIADLQMPYNRFGHSPLTRVAAPREYIGATFIGRFTHEETSADAFLYPGQMTGTATPFNDGALTINAAGAVTQFANGPRRGEDLLLTNVHAFDVKVFDDHPAVVNFKDLGYAGTRGWYARASCANTMYGPRPASPGPDGQPGEAGVDDDGNTTTDDASELGWAGTDDIASNVFDTWSTDFLIDLDNNMTADPVPYRADLRGADFAPGVKGVDDDMANGPDDIGELGWPGSDDYTEVTLPPLKAIQITLRYLDPVSQQMRDVTLIQSLQD